MSEKEMMLRRISAIEFAMWELRIFLNTHPTNTQAMSDFNDYNDKRIILTEQYEEKYGPLSLLGEEENGKWAWISSPWPWENEKEEK